MSEDGAARKARMRAIFDRIMPDYDTAGPGCFAYFGQRLVELVGVEPGQLVLDVATGRGAALLPAAERAGPAAEVIGIDLAEEMVRAARQEVARRGLRASVQVMDAEQLSFPDAGFDRVLCGFGVMFFPNLDRALGEFRRVLSAGGRLGVSSWRVTQADDLAIVLGRLGLIGPAGDELPFRVPAVLERALGAAGFRDVQVLDRRAGRNAGRPRRGGPGGVAEHLRSRETADGIDVEATALMAVAGP